MTKVVRTELERVENLPSWLKRRWKLNTKARMTHR